MFIFETSQLIEQLEQSILISEKSNHYSQDNINEVFRIMHTIKGSSAMMLFDNISIFAHSIEDLFYFLREEKPHRVDYSILFDLILEGIDFIKVELEKIKGSSNADGEASELIGKIKDYLSILKQDNNNSPADTTKQQESISENKSPTSSHLHSYKAVIYFEEGCQMENIRAYTVINNLKEITDEISYIPEDIIYNEDSVNVIRCEGFTIYIKADYVYEEMHKFFMQTIFLKDLELVQLENDEPMIASIEEVIAPESPSEVLKQHEAKETSFSGAPQSIISVNVSKLDKLMDLVGEMVIAEDMVIQNPDLIGLELNSFHKASRQLNKITSEIQDIVMAIRMVPLSTTFIKMHRIVRDMSKKLDKEVQLEIIGEETEVDKNIIEHISDPLMHLVRNAIDHGIELQEERQEKGKPRISTITLEAKNSGSDVLIIVKDDGKGLDKEKILEKARENGLLYKSENDMSDKEIFNLVFFPGFSTKDSITEFSGRGVGMDVVMKNIETVGGSVSVDSILGKGTKVTLKIPLTLAIIDGMNLKVGNSRYTMPIVAIKESFRPKEDDVIADPDGNEMIMVRGQCYPIMKLHEVYKIKTQITNFVDGIIVMVEQDDKTLCIFVDELLGKQQVVVKALPDYIRNFRQIKGLAGCTLLGDGSISLILDPTGLFNL